MGDILTKRQAVYRNILSMLLGLGTFTQKHLDKILDDQINKELANDVISEILAGTFFVKNEDGSYSCAFQITDYDNGRSEKLL